MEGIGRPQDYSNLDTKVFGERPSLGSGWFHNIKKGPKGYDVHTNHLWLFHQINCTSFNLILIHVFFLTHVPCAIISGHVRVTRLTPPV
jgi:hypothetical protein